MLMPIYMNQILMYKMMSMQINDTNLPHHSVLNFNFTSAFYNMFLCVQIQECWKQMLMFLSLDADCNILNVHNQHKSSEMYLKINAWDAKYKQSSNLNRYKHHA
jgi:hypothetical protein